MKTYLIGELPEHERAAEKVEKTTTTTKITKNFDDAEHSLSLTWVQWGITIGVSTVVGLFVRHWLGSS
jgi:hypothetical protein